MNNKETAVKYLNYLSEGDNDKILSVFHDDAVVHSPIYGSMLASEFYSQLATDTVRSEIKLKKVYEAQDPNEIALYFNYKWTMANKETISFDVVDIIRFREDRIIELTIIYDASLTKPFFYRGTE